MRFAGNFHPEWGYPAPNFMRTARVVVVATAIGATAGAAVVLSLAERSAPGAVADAGKTLVVVHSLVQPAEAAAPAAPVAPVAHVQASIQPSTTATAPVMRQPSAPPVTASAQPIAPPPAASEARAVSTSAAPASVAALSESPPVSEASPLPASNAAAVSPVPSTPQKDAIKKPAATGQQLQHGPQPAVAAAPKKKPEERGLGPALRRLFSAN